MAKLKVEDDDHLDGVANTNNNGNVSAKTLSLPEHLILTLILPRLPVKTLIRFKSVSKFWYSSISSPKFAKTHLNFSSSSHQFLLLSSNSFRLLLLTYDDEHNNLKNPVELDFTLDSCFQQDYELEGIANFAGSSNGLICLSNVYSVTKQCIFFSIQCSFFSICNPALHQSSEITNPTSQDFSPMGYWFGYTPSIDDYKIVAPFSSYNAESLQFYVFSLRIGKWKRTCDLDRVDSIYERLSNKTLVSNDILYWSLQFVQKKERPRRIIGFDLVNEQLKEFSWMDWLNNYVDAEFLMIDGCLSLYCRSDDTFSDVWILKQHDDWSSWEKSFSVRLGIMTVFSVIPTRKFLVHDFGLEQGFDQFKVIDVSKGVQEQSQGIAFFAGEHILGGVGYVESLILPSGTIKSTEEYHEENHEV